MAQSVTVNHATHDRLALTASNLAVPVTNVLTTLLELLSLNGVRRVWVKIKPTVHDLNAFQVQGKFHTDDAYVALMSVAGDYTSPNGINVGASGDLTILAAAASGWIAIDVSGLVGLRIQASSASASGTLVDMYANGSS